MQLRAEIVWAAGLFEGEGTITKCNGSLQLRLGMTDYEVVERFFEAVTLGKIYGPYVAGYRDGYARKPRWIWVAEGTRARTVFQTIAPWLSPRRHAQAAALGLFPAGFHVK